MSGMPLLDIFCKGDKMVDLVLVGGTGEVRVQVSGVAEVDPGMPIAEPFFVSQCHNTIGGGCWHNSEKAREQTLGLWWKSCHNGTCDKGWRELKDTRNKVSVEVFGLRKEREA